MIKFIMGGMDVSDNVSSCQFTKSEENGGNGFSAVNGETVSDVTAVKQTAAVKLTELNTSQTASVIDIINSSEIAVDCDFEGYNGNYKCDGGYSVSASRTDTTGIWWEISFTLFRWIPTSNSDDGL